MCSHPLFYYLLAGLILITVLIAPDVVPVVVLYMKQDFLSGEQIFVFDFLRDGVQRQKRVNGKRNAGNKIGDPHKGNGFQKQNVTDTAGKTNR